jgi:formyl-CoA transferase
VSRPDPPPSRSRLLEGTISTTHALDGVVVLDLGQIYNGPYCSLLLAQLGADVIKIEPAAGEPVRWRKTGGRETHAFVLLNSGKRSLRLNLKDPEGRELFLRLTSGADVVVENFAPDTMERLGLGYDELAACNPRLIVASGRGYGPSGPYRRLRAMDLTVQAMTGVMASTGFPDGPPVKAGPAIADFLGGIHLMAAVVTALYQRTVTGRGQHVEVAMQDAVIPSLCSSIAGYLDSDGDLPERTGNRHSGLSVTPYNVYPADDGWIAILCITNRHWFSLCGLLERPDLADDPGLATSPGRVARMDELDEIVGAWTARFGKEELFASLQEAGIPAAPVRDIADLFTDEGVRSSGALRQVDHPRSGRAWAFGSPLRLGDSPPIAPAAAPTLGEHTDQVLTDRLGLSATELSRLRERSVI